MTENTWPAHPYDERIAASVLDSDQYGLGYSHVASVITQCAALYVVGRIPFEEFDERVDTVLAEAEQ